VRQRHAVVGGLRGEQLAARGLQRLVGAASTRQAVSPPGTCCSRRTTRIAGASMSPLSSETSPTSAPSSVDFPQPFGPIRAMRSPGAIDTSAFSTSMRPPREKLTRRSRIIAPPRPAVRRAKRDDQNAGGART
jgi:hypothetical protein